MLLYSICRSVPLHMQEEPHNYKWTAGHRRVCHELEPLVVDGTALLGSRKIDQCHLVPLLYNGERTDKPKQSGWINSTTDKRKSVIFQ